MYMSRVHIHTSDQVLSESVIIHLVGGNNVSEMAKFVAMIDKFFDTLNVFNFSTVIQKRKPFQNPYQSANDFRLVVSNVDVPAS